MENRQGKIIEHGSGFIFLASASCFQKVEVNYLTFLKSAPSFEVRSFPKIVLLPMEVHVLVTKWLYHLANYPCI